MEDRFDQGFDCIEANRKRNAAIHSVKAIAQAQNIYSLKKGRGKFADLATLGKERLIDSELASGERQGYLFTSEPVLVKDELPLFDTTAKPTAIGTLGTGSLSFYSNETMVVYEAKGGAPNSDYLGPRA